MRLGAAKDNRDESAAAPPVDSAIAGLEEAEERRGNLLRLIQIRLATRGFGKNLACLSTNSSRAPVAASSSIEAVSFSSTRTAKRFSSLRCAAAIQIVRPLESIKWQMKCVPMSSTIPAHVYCLSHDAVIRIYDAAGNVIPVNVRPPCLTDYSLS